MRRLTPDRRMRHHWLLLVLFIFGYASSGSSNMQMLLFTSMFVRSPIIRRFFIAPAQYIVPAYRFG